MQPAAEGYVVLDLFSGISTALRACLENGMQIKHYYSVEPDMHARAVQVHHVNRLLAEFPGLLGPASVSVMHSALPQDIRHVGRANLQLLPPVDLVFAGWECQGHSRAGKGRGLSDHRSRLFYDMVRVLNDLHDLSLSRSPGQPVGYVLENVASGLDPREKSGRTLQLFVITWVKSC